VAEKSSTGEGSTGAAAGKADKHGHELCDRAFRPDDEQVVYERLCRSKLDTLTLEIAFGSWAGDSTLEIATRLRISRATVRRRFKAFTSSSDHLANGLS